MKRSTSLNNGFAVVVGAFFILQGLWGLTSDVVFGLLSTNKTHAVIHLILGILSLTFGLRQNAREFTIFLGLLLLTVGTLRFIPEVDAVLIDLLNVNENVAFLNIALGAAALAIASPKPLVIAETQETIETAADKPKPNSRRITSTPIKKNHITAASKPASVVTKPKPVAKETQAAAKKPVEKKVADPKPATPPKSTSKKNPRRKNKPISGEKS